MQKCVHPRENIFKYISLCNDMNLNLWHLIELKYANEYSYMFFWWWWFFLHKALLQVFVNSPLGENDNIKIHYLP